MKITVITGSGRRHGTSSYLADEFIRGAKDAGNQVFRFDAAFEKLHPCIGCNMCRKSGSCIQSDTYNKLIPEILESDEIVWVTPIYYMTMTAQIKIVIDRFYQLETDSRFKGGKKYIILATAWDSKPNVFKVLVDTFKAFSKFLRWEKVGQILAGGMDTREQIENSHYGRVAYELGRKQQ